MTQNQIRPIAICVFQYRNRILVFEGYDSIKNEFYYRPLGGSIEFGEHSSVTIAREIKEELAAEIFNPIFLGSIESIFIHNGKPGHELVQVYKAEFVNPEFYQRHSFEAFEDDGTRMKVM